jgi:ubiquinone/menaquinone biosynthesis C-methylase UbiE
MCKGLSDRRLADGGLMVISTRDFDKESASWDEVPARVRLARDVAASIAGEVALAPDMDALDFGCGTGLVTLQLQPLVRTVTAIDSSRGMLDVLKAKVVACGLSNVTIWHRDVERGDVLEGSFQLVVSSMTLHHIRGVGSLLAQFNRICAPGGYLCIADLDPDDGRFHENPHGVFHCGFDRAALRRQVAEAGFGDVRDRTAAEITRIGAHGEQRLFTVFLVTGRKRS